MELEEKTVALEQGKKRKKHKKLVIIGCATAIAAAAFTALYFLWGRQFLAAKSAADSVKIQVGANQSVRYAKIESINGNEISVTYMTQIEKQKWEGKEAPESGEMPEGFGGGQFPGGGEMPEGFGGGQFPGGGEMPEGFGGGQFPGGGEMPEGFSGGQFPGGGEMPEGFSGGQFPDRGNTKRQGAATGEGASSKSVTIDGNSYVLTDETETTYIPVGTVVTTKLGTETTFSRLQAGDYIAIVTEKAGNEDVIAAIYIVG